MKKIIIIFILITGLYSIAEAQLVQSNFQGVLVPQYIASGTSTRLPYIFRATVTGLQPNLKYRYYTNACRYTDFGGTNSGAGNPLFINGSDFRYTTSTGLSTVNRIRFNINRCSRKLHRLVRLFIQEMQRFTAGNFVYPSITLDSGGNGVTKYRFALNDSISVLQFSDSGTVHPEQAFTVYQMQIQRMLFLYMTTSPEPADRWQLYLRKMKELILQSWLLL
ncbi:MAG: hypothetical protein IPG09_15940 [Ignavibacteria bacterium]|nr:hypothetical protein [Ignavibacteria bacterium]